MKPSSAIELEAAKKASEKMRNMQHMWAVVDQKENNTVIEAMENMVQKYSDRKSSKKHVRNVFILEKICTNETVEGFQQFPCMFVCYLQN